MKLESKTSERVATIVKLTTPNGSKIISGNTSESKVTNLQALTTGNFPYIYSKTQEVFNSKLKSFHIIS